MASPEGKNQRSDVAAAGVAVTLLEFDGRLVDQILERLGALVVILNPAGEIVFFNSACQRLTGYTAEEARGRRPWDFLLDAEDAANAEETFGEVVQEDIIRHPRHTWVAKNDRKILIEWSNSAFRDEDGCLLYIVGTGLDVTAEARFEESFLDSERRASAIVDTVPDAMLIIDTGGTIRFANPATERQFGYSADELVGNSIRMLAAPPYDRELDSHLKHYLETGEKRIIGTRREVRGERKNGTTFPMEVSVGEFQDGERYFVGFAHDISARKQAEGNAAELQLQLERISRLTALGEMGSVLAHELNQPLTAVVNYVEALRRMISREAGGMSTDTADLLDRAVVQAHRASETATRLKNFVTADLLQTEVENINDVIEEAASLVVDPARNERISLRMDLAETLPPVRMDRLQIQLVLFNLLRNAVEAMADSDCKELRVHTSANPDGFVEISVSDSGPGFRAENIDRAFEPFATTKEQGTGLGLAISRTIVDAHGGKIWLASAPGAGAEFRFTLPAIESASPAHAH